MKTLAIPFLLGLALAPCLASSDSVVVFNEIMYHPVSDEESEWVELHNQMSVDIDLSRWRLDGGATYKFPEATVIPAGGYLVVAANPDGLENALGPFEGKLDNGGETLRLHSASGRLMNRVRYRDGGDWPVGADGSGASLAKVVGDSSAPEGAHWAASAQKGGTPGQVNFPEDRHASSTLVINEWVGEGADDFWIELTNLASELRSLNGLTLTQGSTGESHAFAEGDALEAGAFLLIGNEAFPSGAGDGDKLFLLGPDEALLDAVEVKKRSRGRSPDGSASHAYVSEETPGGPNGVTLNTDVVINEILYHHRPQYRDGELPFSRIDEEWIELYHRGDVAVELGGWELDGDIDYTFPEGTQLEPGGFLVIEKGEGGFDGSLPNGSGHIELKDADGNLADEVHYFDDGHWPKAADGGGSSLELRDPFADNDRGSSWAASDETARTEWQEIRYRGVAARSVVGPDNQWRELVIGLLDSGEILIDDVRVNEDPDGRNGSFINNSQFQSSIFGGGPLRNWRLRGNHRHGEIVPDPDDPSNNVLKLVAGGAAGHMHNHVETTFSGGARVTNGETYEISFRARPVSGSPQLLTRLYFNRLAKTHVLKTPSEIGTPGARNSRLELNIGPSLSDMQHTPVVPTADEPVEIRVRAEDPNGVANLVLFSSVNGGEFSSTPMVEQGADLFTASLPSQDVNAIVQFYVAATDSEGAVSHFPADGPDSRALYQVLDPERLSETPLNHFRIIMHPSDTEWMHDAINLMSDGRVPGTVIYKENEVFYDVGVRLKGSERGRVTTQRLGFNVKFPQQQLFRGTHRTVAVDRSEGVGTGQFEILFNLMMTHSGASAAEYNDLIHVISPQDRHTGPAELQLARYGDVFLDSQFEDGSDGNLFEYELIYYPTSDDSDGYKRPSPDLVVGSPVRDLGDNPEDYRWIYLLKNNRKRDDFSGVMRYAKLFSKGDEEFQAELPHLVDVDQWLQGMASALLSGAGDQYGANSQHNGMFYERPDGKFIFFPHDIDFAFNPSRSMTENNELKKIIRNPAYERMYLAHVNNIITTTYNEAYMTRWANHYGELLPGQNFTSHLNYVSSRSRNAKSQIGRMVPTTAFRIETESGGDFEVDTLSTEIVGKGAINLHRLIHVETGDELTPEWLDLDTWKVALTLQPGENVFTLQGVNVLGGVGSIFSPVGKGKITITSTAEPADLAPVRALALTRVQDGQVSLSYERSVPNGLTVTIEGSVDLKTWSALDHGEESVEANGDTEGVTVPIELGDGAVQFVRLKLTSP